MNVNVLRYYKVMFFMSTIIRILVILIAVASCTIVDGRQPEELTGHLCLENVLKVHITNPYCASRH